MIIFNIKIQCNKSIGASARLNPLVKQLLQSRNGKQAIWQLVQNNRHTGVREFNMKDLRRWISYLGS